ncbi:MAG: AAC(3) family N-acetyltransferase [Myxococcales bacterium]|nr:AAC(3) family N-acetyltransferase [Myxococcales bacterium]
MSCSVDELVRALRALGVEPGCTLVVHTAFSQVRPVEDGPRGLIAALQRAVGDSGTLVMPSMADDDDAPFDARTTPCLQMGVVAQTFWQLPGVLRSDSPHAFAACGRAAEAITRAHPPDVPHGLDSPVGRAYARGDGHVLLLGVGHHANTTIHLAENIAGVRYGVAARAHVRDASGAPKIISYREVDHCCERFAQMDEWLDARALQRRGRVGAAEARLVASRDVVSIALEQIAADEKVFLHAAGKCSECDEARRATVR